MITKINHRNTFYNNQHLDIPCHTANLELMDCIPDDTNEIPSELRPSNITDELISELDGSKMKSHHLEVQQLITLI